MSVDYSQCDSCKLGYRDDSDWACYCDCGSNFCGAICGKLKNYKPYNEDEDENYEGQRIDRSNPITCIVCREEIFTDYGLLQGLLFHFNITRDQAIELIRAKK